jgi:5-formyltetrahydrofolate cyclo-ligase
MDDKRALRMHLRAARARRSSTDLLAAGTALAGQGVHAIGAARTVAVYASVQDEPPTRPLLEELQRRQVRLLLPRVSTAGLEWAPYESWSALVTTERGLLEPTAPAVRAAMAGLADVVLAPALAVDRRGNRLGRGAGYYDRALGDVARQRIIAVVFDDEVLDELPAEPHDIPVSAALTPSGLVRIDDQ